MEMNPVFVHIGRSLFIVLNVIYTIFGYIMFRSILYPSIYRTWVRHILAFILGLILSFVITLALRALAIWGYQFFFKVIEIVF